MNAGVNQLLNGLLNTAAQPPMNQNYIPQNHTNSLSLSDLNQLQQLLLSNSNINIHHNSMSFNIQNINTIIPQQTNNINLNFPTSTSLPTTQNTFHQMPPSFKMPKFNLNSTRNLIIKQEQNPIQHRKVCSTLSMLPHKKFYVFVTDIQIQKATKV